MQRKPAAACRRSQSIACRLIDDAGRRLQNHSRFWGQPSLRREAMRSPRSRIGASFFVRLMIASLLVVCSNTPVKAQFTPSSATDEETARQQQIVARFLTVLERNPR